MPKNEPIGDNVGKLSFTANGAVFSYW